MSFLDASKVFLSTLKLSLEQSNVIRAFLGYTTLQFLVSRRSKLVSITFKHKLRNLVERITPNPIIIDGCIFHTDCLDDLGIIHPFFEHWMRQQFMSKLKEGSTFIDIGAHIGKYTIKAGKIVGESGLVVAIEANPRNFNLLKKNVMENNLRNVVLYNVAAYNKEGIIEFYISDRSGDGSVKFKGGKGKIKVQARTVDSIVEEVGVKPDLVKIDVEGVEYEVLQGMEKTLKKYKPMVLCEVFDENRNRVLTLMGSLGYKYEVLMSGKRWFEFMFV